MKRNKSKQIKSNPWPVRNAYREHQESLTHLQRTAVWITERIGTMGFFFILVCWAAFWILWNIFGPKQFRFDPYPGFILWIFISNMIQLMLMPLIMVGQNLQNRHAAYRSEADFDLNKRAESEVETILLRLDKQNKLIGKILDELQSKK